MQKFEPGEDRWKLGFKEAVLSSFGFLHSRGFRSVAEEITMVRYESQNVYVNIYHGRGSFEIGAEVGRISGGDCYGLDYIVSWAGKEAWDAEGFGRGTLFQVSTKQGVQNTVPKVAKILEKYGGPFLSGDPAFYENLQRVNEESSLAFEKEQMVTRIRKEANTAWTAKDFARVVELFQPIRDNLTEIDRKKLVYAEKHVKTGVQKKGKTRRRG